jgi:hypothetical protein
MHAGSSSCHFRTQRVAVRQIAPRRHARAAEAHACSAFRSRLRPVSVPSTHPIRGMKSQGLLRCSRLYASGGRFPGWVAAGCFLAGGLSRLALTLPSPASGRGKENASLHSWHAGEEDLRYRLAPHATPTSSPLPLAGEGKENASLHSWRAGEEDLRYRIAPHATPTSSPLPLAGEGRVRASPRDAAKAKRHAP